MAQLKERHPCAVCNRTYERADHLRRHVRSHENSRSFRCAICRKGFNRADLLHRHELAHIRRRFNSGAPRRAQRASQACTACVQAKAKCGDEKPCGRCKARALECDYMTLPSEESPVSPADADATHHDSTLGAACLEPYSASQQQGPLTEHSMSGPKRIHEMPDEVDMLPLPGGHLDDPSVWVLPNVAQPNPELLISAIQNPDYAKICHFPHISNLVQDIDFNFADLDFPAIDLGMFSDIFGAAATEHRKADSTVNMTLPAPPANRNSRPDPHTRSEVFRRSPWAHWRPSQYHHAFTGQEVIDAGVVALPPSASPLYGVSPNFVIEDELDEAGRDKILQVVMSLKSFRFSVPSFPSLELLNNLIRAFFAQDNGTIAPGIHLRTYSCRNTRPVLLLGIVAAGAIAIPVNHIQQIGLVIHEVLRLATTELFESNNSLTRDLQAMQAYFKVLEIGAWSGIKRKTEIACSFMQPLYTMLRQSGALSRSHYEEPVRAPNGHANDADHQWRSWAARESLNRLTIRAFIHDSQLSMAFLQTPVIPYSHLAIPVPAPAKSWFAADAMTWVECSVSADYNRPTPLLTEVFGDLTMLDNYSKQTDTQLCCFAAIHALANQVWDLRQQLALLGRSGGCRQRGLDSWCTYRQRDLYEELTAARMYCERRAPHCEIMFLLEYIMMSLYVSLFDIQRFAGKEGEAEARRLTPILAEWSQAATARTAIWHAGQVLRIARCFPLSTLRKFYAVGTYHAALTLWVYGMLRNGQRPSGMSTPLVDSPAIDVAGLHAEATSGPSPALVRLDGAEDSDVRTFILLGYGSPGLGSPMTGLPMGSGPNQAQLDFNLRGFRPLTNPACAMDVAGEILRKNALFADNSLPHLVQNLVGLMGDLGSLSRDSTTDVN